MDFNIESRLIGSHRMKLTKNPLNPSNPMLEKETTNNTNDTNHS